MYTTQWREPQRQEQYTFAPPSTNQPDNIYVATPPTTSQYDFEMQMLASAQMQGVNTARPTLPWMPGQFDPRALVPAGVGMNGIMALPKPFSTRVSANAAMATHDPLPARTNANTDTTGAETANAPGVMATTESVAAADGTNIADRLKRRSALRQFGPRGLPPPTPRSTDSEPSASSSYLSGRASVTARGAAQTGPEVQKGHNRSIPKRVLSQTPKAIAARARRADEAQNAGKKQGPLPSPAAATPATSVDTDMRRLVASQAIQSLDPAASVPAVTPAKRATAHNADESMNAKRVRIMPSPKYFEDASETMASSPETTPNSVAAADKPTGDVLAKHLQLIREYSRPGEDLDWMKETSSKKRAKMQKVLFARKATAVRTAESRRKQKEAPTGEAFPSQAAQQTADSHRDPPADSTSDTTVLARSDRRSTTHEQPSGRLTTSDLVTAEPAMGDARTRTTTDQQHSPIIHLLDNPDAEKLSNVTLADIQKYSNPGEDLDWTKVTDLAERSRRMTTFINRRSTLQHQQQREQLGSITPAPSAAPASPAAKAGSAEHEPLDESLGVPLQYADERLTPEAKAEVARYSNPGEDLDWTQVVLPSERMRRYRTVLNRKAVYNKTGTAWRSQVPPPPPANNVPHPSTGRPVSAKSLADIAKYSQEGKDLDWTKCKNAEERERLQKIIKELKRYDPEVHGASRRTSRVSETEALVSARDIRKFTKPRCSMSRDHTVNEGESGDDAEHMEKAGDPIESDGAPAEPAAKPSKSSRNAKSLADIAKYTLEGEDLDSTKVQDPAKRRAIQRIVSDRKSKDSEAVRIRAPAHTPSFGEAGLTKTKRVARGSTHFTSTVSVADDDAADSELGEDPDFDGDNLSPGGQALARLTTHPNIVARPLSAQAAADIAKYSRAGEDLDWSKLDDAHERKRLQNLIAHRKYQDSKTATRRKAVPTKPHGVDSAPQGDLESAQSDVDPEAEVNEDVDEGAADDEDAVSSTPFDMPEPQGLDDLRVIDFAGGSFSDPEFVQNLKAILYRIGKSKSNSFYSKQCRRIGTLLNAASPPKSGEVLYKYTSEQAAKVVETNAYFAGPMVTYGQQPMPLQSQEQFFAEYYDESVEVNVQDPSTRVAKLEPHVRKVNMSTVKARFSQPVKGTPWNILELAAHREDGLRPEFLNNEDCTLLTKLKLPCSGETANRLGYTEGWREVEKWVLAAQAGALTEPHQDSHGYSTYITVNEGTVGFGWLSNPTDDERAAWSKGHDSYTGGRWRYVVLRAGATVYFPAGTVHFVFRHPGAGNTLAFGGHVLRCSQIVRWVRVLLAEQSNGYITNEDLSVSAPGYLNRVEKYVKQAQKSGREEMWGGKEAIDEFLKLKQDFTAQAARIEKSLKKAGKRA
ncbi:hypothetical protein B0A55_02586 [Friedmanniomyces simplex]|uniref:JmjC domain-containing protein n=1 Tax=Friedmanniomyces simplex TaxID=329884 RepID=A0A4V5NJG2_9PEZI|nr:hypothetical protein B0A55_02586 [Friedmanniomyces simplex]